MAQCPPGSLLLSVRYSYSNSVTEELIRCRGASSGCSQRPQRTTRLEEGATGELRVNHAYLLSLSLSSGLRTPGGVPLQAEILRALYTEAPQRGSHKVGDF